MSLRLRIEQPCQSLFVAPCSHVWHYKCIRPILNDHRTWPQFLCPNCRFVTDLEADVDDPDEEWPDDDNDALVQTGTQPAPHTNGITRDGSVNGQRKVDGTRTEDALAEAMERQLSVREDNQLAPMNTASSDPTGQSSAGATRLLDRRGAPPMLSPFPALEPDTTAVSPNQVQYLRPITPTEPLMGHADINSTSLHTPTTDQLITDGPMTPTNTAGPFVFDGSAGRQT